MKLSNPDLGFFGKFGGRYVSEILRPSLDQLDAAFRESVIDPSFMNQFHQLAIDFIGRPTPLLEAVNSTRILGGGRIFVKMEGNANTGAHKINNALGQALLAKRLGKKRVIAETGAGQHGVATAAAAAYLGLDCDVYMGEVDMARQHPNVLRMELFGARVIPVKWGSRTLKDAVNEALKDWSASYSDTHYIIGSVLGPSPFPEMVREFQSVVGNETKMQLERKGLTPSVLVACVGGGSNSIGFFAPFLEDEKIHLVGVEAGGRSFKDGDHASRLNGRGKPAIVQGYKSLFLTDSDGQLLDTHSISAGLDYPGVGPQLAHLGETGRIEFTSATDMETCNALDFFAKNEGLLFALESAHAAAEVIKLAPKLKKEEVVVVNMSGRGDKDLFITSPVKDPEGWIDFLQSEIDRVKAGMSTGGKP